MKSLILSGMLIVGIGVVPSLAGGRLEISAATMNEINITTDSSRGWIPTAELRQLALKTLEGFLDALEGGRYAEAYGLQTEINKRDQTLAQFSQGAQKFRALAGPVKFWKVLKITWTKDPAQAPFRGVYAAIDLAGQFANVDRSCGYMVLYQQAEGGDFTVIRRENNYLDNATARSIEEKQSKAEVVKAWRQLSQYCPIYDSSLDAR
jgi:hypothetical protein